MTREQTFGWEADQKSFDDALYESFETQGTTLLESPKRLLGLTIDISAQETAELRVFEHNCDQELLEPFKKALADDANGSSLDDAAERATMVLRDRAIDPEIARRTAWGIRNAIARNEGIPVVEQNDQYRFVPEDTPSIATPSIDGSAMKTTRTTPVARERSSMNGTHPHSATRSIPRSAPPHVSSTGSSQSMPPYAPRAVPYVNPPQRKTHAGLVILLVTLIIAVGVAACILFSGVTDQDQTASVSFFGGNGTTGTMETTQIKRGTRVILPSCGFRLEGYRFDSWLDKDGVVHLPGDEVDITDDATYWAQWTEDDGGEDSTDNLFSSAPTVVTPVKEDTSG